MNIDVVLNIALVMALSITPVSVIVIQVFSKVFSKYNSHLAKTTVICTTTLEALTKGNFNIQSLTFDKYRVNIDQESQLVMLENYDTGEEKRLEKNKLHKEEAVRYMAITTALCHFPKIQKIEEVLARFFLTCGINNHQIREKHEIVAKIPSSEEKKFSSVVASNRDSKEIFSFAKGQAGVILKRCSRILINGKKIDIDNKLRQKLKKKIHKLNKNGQKTIAFAYKPLPIKRLSHYVESFVENDMVLLGIAGLGDILNTDLLPTIEEIKSFGIKIYLLSPTKEQKSIAAAHELRISSPKYFESLDSEYLSTLNNDQLSKLFNNKEKDYTFYNLKENDQQRIIEILQKNGEVIAINNQDPHHDLQFILEGIKKERYKKDNYRKLLFHSLSCKIIEVILLCAALILQAPLALSVILILALDLTLNLFLESTLRLEKPLAEDSNDKGHLLVTGIFAGIVISAIYIWSLMRFGWTPGEPLNPTDTAFVKSSTMAFLLLCLVQISTALSIKANKKSLFRQNPLKTPYLTLTAVISILVVYIITHFEFFQINFNLTKLSLLEWEILIFAVALVILVEELRKYANSKK